MQPVRRNSGPYEGNLLDSSSDNDDDFAIDGSQKSSVSVDTNRDKDNEKEKATPIRRTLSEKIFEKEDKKEEEKTTNIKSQARCRKYSIRISHDDDSSDDDDKNAPINKIPTEKLLRTIADSNTKEDVKNCALNEVRKRIAENRASHVKLMKEKMKMEVALAQQTGMMAANNHQVNVQNRIDIDQIHKANIGQTVTRVISAIISVALLIITVVCIVL